MCYKTIFILASGFYEFLSDGVLEKTVIAHALQADATGTIVSSTDTLITLFDY